MTDMRTTRAGIIGVGQVIPDMRTTRAGHIYVYSELPGPEDEPENPAPVTGNAALARGGACYLDSFLEYDGRNVATADGLFPGVSVQLSGGTTWLAGETLTLTASQPIFTADEVGNVLILHGSTVRFTITVYGSTTVVQGVTDIAVPTAMQTDPVTVWDRAVDVIAGLEHLEGALVGILGDDHVVGSPYNVAITRRTVEDGEVELGDFYSHVFVGLPYLSDLETLDIDKPSGSTYKTTKQAVTNVGVIFLKSRSVWVGGQPPTDDSVDPVESLRELPAAPIVGDPAFDTKKALYESLTSEFDSVNVNLVEWRSSGRVFIRSLDPVPATILAAVPTGDILPTG